MVFAVGAAFGLAGQDLATGDPGTRTQAQPTGEMPHAGKAGQVGADFAQHDQSGGDVDAIDPGQVHTAHPEQVGAQVESRRIAGSAPLWTAVFQKRFFFIVPTPGARPVNFSVRPGPKARRNLSTGSSRYILHVYTCSGRYSWTSTILNPLN
jgi:hypothetical protein